MNVFINFLRHFKIRPSLSFLYFVMVLGVAAPFLPVSSSSAAIYNRDVNAVHERFDSLESKIDGLIANLNDLTDFVKTIKKNEETVLRNQADLKEEFHFLNNKLTAFSGVSETNNFNLVESIKKLSKKFEEDLQKFKEFDITTLLEEGKKEREAYQKDFQIKLESIDKRIADLASIYKTLSQEEIERNYEDITNFNRKMEEISAPINQLIQLYKDMAVDQIFREDNLITKIGSQLDRVNENISQLIDIYKQSISTVKASNKDNLAKFEVQLTVVNSKIKKLTEIYITTVKENNAMFNTLSNNLSKELQTINDRLSNFNLEAPSDKKTASTVNSSGKLQKSTTKK